MLKKSAQQGRSKRRDEVYSVRYVEPLSEVRTPPGKGAFRRAGAGRVRRATFSASCYTFFMWNSVRPALSLAFGRIVRCIRNEGSCSTGFSQQMWSPWDAPC